MQSLRMGPVIPIMFLAISYKTLMIVSYKINSFHIQGMYKNTYYNIYFECANCWFYNKKHIALHRCTTPKFSRTVLVFKYSCFKIILVSVLANILEFSRNVGGFHLMQKQQSVATSFWGQLYLWNPLICIFLLYGSYAPEQILVP
jgi:hypothetical protein